MHPFTPAVIGVLLMVASGSLNWVSVCCGIFYPPSSQMFWGRLPNLEDADGTGLLMLQMNYNRRNMMHTHNMCFFSYCLL